MISAPSSTSPFQPPPPPPRIRLFRALILSVCTPFLFPLLCLVFPVFFAARLFLRFLRRRRIRAAKLGNDGAGGRLRRCEEGRGELGGGDLADEPEPEMEIEAPLLQRYLEDQLGLARSVAAAVDCEDEEKFRESGTGC